MAHIALDEGRRDDAVALLDEAGAVTDGCGAEGVMRSVEGARTRL
ncbi:hypothetical protein [Nonomuraea sp. NPDC050202]